MDSDTNLEGIMDSKTIFRNELLEIQKGIHELIENKRLEKIELDEIGKDLCKITEETNKLTKEINKKWQSINNDADFPIWDDIESIELTEKMKKNVKGTPVLREQCLYNHKYIIVSTKEGRPFNAIATYIRNNDCETWEKIVLVQIEGRATISRLAASFVKNNVKFYKFC
jgi:uncharacterized FlaG/YvyC family protein